MITDEEIKKAKVTKYLCQTSSLFFTRYFFKQRFKKKFIVSGHHELICNALDRVIQGKTKRLIINIAPRYGKTELAVKNFIAHGLAINPSARFIHLSYSDDLALNNSDETKDIVKSEEYKKLFGVKISAKTDSKKIWYTTGGGGVYATSAGGQVTGFGAGIVEEEFSLPETENVFGGALIIDDPIKPDDADSETIRERVNNKYESTLKNRVNSRNTPIIIIMQRLHEQDLCGFLLENEKDNWEVLSLPCIIDEHKEGERALWEHKHTLVELRDMQELDERTGSCMFERQYMQDPKPLKGLLFPPNELRYFKPSEALTKEFDNSNAYVDVADQGEDYLSAPFMRNIGTDVYITDVVHTPHTSEISIEHVANKCKEQKTAYIRCESNNQGHIWSKELRIQLEKNKCDTTVWTAVNTANKFARIFNSSAFIRKNFLFLEPEFQSDEYKLFMKHMCSYLKNGKTKKMDDSADAITGGAIFLRSILPDLYS